MPRNYNAFTLAEVLITLVIIGVIAAMTIPTLMKNTNKQEYVTGLKKGYSILSQVTNRIIAEEGSPKNGWLQTGDVDSIYDRYKKYLNIAKDCGSSSGCLDSSGYKSYYMVSGGWNFEQTRYRKLVLSDGMQIIFGDNPLNNACTKNEWGTTEICAPIFIDVNGYKKPNKYGIDFFVFAVKENGLYPMGCESAYCDGTYGDGCTCKVLREGTTN